MSVNVTATASEFQVQVTAQTTAFKVGVTAQRSPFVPPIVVPPVVEPDPILKTGTTIFFDNFENGTGPWNNNGELNAGGETRASSTIQPTFAFSGSNSLRMRSNENGLAQTNNFRYRSYVIGDDVVYQCYFILYIIFPVENGIK